MDYDFDQTADRTLYVGTQHGVYRLRGTTWEHVPSDLFQVVQVVADHRGRVWLMETTYNQLYVYDGQHFRELKDQTDLSIEKLDVGSLRLNTAGDVLVDIAARPADRVPTRTYKWPASAEGKVGEAVQVK
jgi:hypothetical protein